MHEYSRDDFRDCLAQRRVLFIGDSVTRQLFFAAAKRLDFAKADEKFLEVFVSDNPQHDVTLDVEDVSLEFIWDPWLNSTRLREELTHFRPATSWPAIHGHDDDPAALVVLGSPGLWAARNGGDAYFNLFRRSVDAVRPYLSRPVTPHGRADVAYRDLDNHILLAPVQVPWFAKLSSRRAETLSPPRIQRMNDFLDNLPAAERSHVVGTFNKMTRDIEPRTFVDTGLHVTEGVAERWIDVVLNVRCNSALVSNGWANKRTCCVRSPRLVRGQVILVCLSLVPALFLVVARRTFGPLARRLPSPRILKALLVIGALPAYCYLADRTHLFAKTERHYDRQELTYLWAALVSCYVCSVGRVSSAVGRQSTKPTSHKPDGKDAGFLSRDVTDEWKGWMQSGLLLFSFQQTDEASGVYKLTRLFGAAYIFLSAYGHTMYFIRTEDFSFRRVAAVLFRLNALSCVAALFLRVDWTVYYFPRIVSFWFLVNFATLRVFRRVNRDPARLFAKIVVAALLTTGLSYKAGILDYTGWAFGLFCRLYWPGEEIRGWIAVDRYIPFFGMIAALLANRMALIRARYRDTPGRRVRFPSQLDNMLFAVLHPDQHTAPIYPIILCFSAAFLMLFLVETQSVSRYPSHEAYDRSHPYLSCMAALAFAVLRNCHRVLRNAYLRLPAAVGRMALELYVFHRHILLSGDGTGLLRIGLWSGRGGAISSAGWGLETIVLTIVLFWASRAARDAMSGITTWIFGESIPQDVHPTEDEDLEMALGAAGTGLLDPVAATDSRKGAKTPRPGPALRSDGARLRGMEAPLRAGLLLLLLWIVNILY